MFIKSCRVVRASDRQCQSRNNPRFNPSILRRSGVWGAADEAVLDKVHKFQAKNCELSWPWMSSDQLVAITYVGVINMQKLIPNLSPPPPPVYSPVAVAQFWTVYNLAGEDHVGVTNMEDLTPARYRYPMNSRCNQLVSTQGFWITVMFSWSGV